LRAILFDVDDTLYPTTLFARRAQREAAAAMVAAGLAVSPDLVAEELAEVVSEFPSNYDRHYDALLARLPASACGQVNPAVIVASGVAAYHETKRRELTASRAAIDVLAHFSRMSGLLLGAVTSGVPVKQAEKLVRLGVLPYMAPRAVFFAEQMGYSKSNPKLYRQVCLVLGLPPADCMYVGDHPERDIDAPRAAGLVAVRYQGDGKYAGVSGRGKPDYEIRELGELIGIVGSDFAVPDEAR
jgi:putative hydrolase of the HAD superfamily